MCPPSSGSSSSAAATSSPDGPPTDDSSSDRVVRTRLGGNTFAMPRAIWSGSISFGLVSIPIKLYAAVSRKTVHFNQLDSRTGARVKHKKVSAADGEEVPA